MKPDMHKPGHDNEGVLPLLVRMTAILAAGVALASAVMLPLEARQAPRACRVAGKVTSGTTPLPGVSIVVETSGAPGRSRPPSQTAPTA